jgi:hypothetical protein
VSYSYACSLDPVVCLAWPFPDVVHIFRVFLIWLCITRRCFPGGFVTFGLVRSRIFGGGCWRNFLALRAASVVRKVIGARASVSVIVFMHHLMHQILHCNCILEYILYAKFIRSSVIALRNLSLRLCLSTWDRRAFWSMSCV